MTFVATAAGWGLTVSLEKTKLMSMGSPGDNVPIQLENGRGNSCCGQFYAFGK